MVDNESVGRCYTKELKQKQRIYSIGKKGTPIPFFENGIDLSALVLGGVMILALVLIALIANANHITFIAYAIKHATILVLAGVGLFIWIMFSMQWDRKGFFVYLYDRILFRIRGAQSFEHGLVVPRYTNETIRYSKIS